MNRQFTTTDALIPVVSKSGWDIQTSARTALKDSSILCQGRKDSSETGQTFARIHKNLIAKNSTHFSRKKISANCGH